MIIFLAPGLPAAGLPASERVLRCVEGLVEAAYSRLPEHLPVKEQVVPLNLRARAIAADFGLALPEELQEFWEAYSGWFAMYSVGPLLGNGALASAAVGSADIEAMVVENWRSAGWWSGRGLLEPALVEVLAEWGITLQARPGALLRSLRPIVANLMAARAGQRALRAEAARFVRSKLASLGTREPEPADLLWLSVGASSAEQIHVLTDAARVSGLSSQILDFDYFGSHQALSRFGLPHRSLAAFMDAAVLNAENQISRRLRRWWPDIAKAARQLPLDGIGPRQREAMIERLRVVLLRDAPSWRLQAQAAHRALDRYQPRAVIGFHVYGPIMAPMIIAARRRGIPRLGLQHGVIGPRYLALPCLPYDEKLVFGSYAASIMQQVAHPGMKVTVTGHSLYDQAREPVTPRPEVLALRDGVPGLVVLCTQFNEHLFYKQDGWWLSEAARACRELGLRLALKLHPSDSEYNLTLYRKLLQPGDDRVLLVPHGQYPLAELLAACDLMITRDSTVVFEANLLDKPVLTINTTDWDEELPYAQTGGALGVYRLEDIQPAIRSLIWDEQARQRLADTRRDFLLEHTGPRDGQATRRITEIIASYATGTSRPSSPLL